MVKLLSVLFSFSLFAADILLIKGTPVDKEAYPGIVDIRSGNAGCTATVVGPRVIVTAAHCVENGQKSTFKIDGINYTTVGLRHPNYNRGIDTDVAVGISAAEFATAPYSIGSERVKVGEKIDLFGYGCTKSPGTGGNDGVLRTGMTTVTRASSQDVRKRPFRPAFVSYDFTMKDSSTGVALCYGDSGGPAFSGLYQVGVNSKGNIRDTSYNLDLTHPEVQEWLLKVASDKKVDICGVSVECK